MKAINLLLVEDNPADVELTRETLESCKFLHNLAVASDGVSAMDYLRKKPPFENAKTPDLILLDLNLPRKDGRVVLKEIKEDPSLKMTPVVILTSSQAEADILATYRLNANAYITKPVDLKGFEQIVQAIQEFWFTVVKYPTSS